MTGTAKYDQRMTKVLAVVLSAGAVCLAGCGVAIQGGNDEVKTVTKVKTVAGPYRDCGSASDSNGLDVFDIAARSVSCAEAKAIINEFDYAGSGVVRGLHCLPSGGSNVTFEVRCTGSGGSKVVRWYPAGE